MGLIEHFKDDMPCGLTGDPIKKELTESQKAFCLEWIFDFNGSRAYKAVYPDVTDGSARTLSSALLTNIDIKAYCKQLQDNLAETSGISRLKVIREHEKLAFSSIAHLHNTWITRKEFDELTEDQKASIAEISTQTRQETVGKGTRDESVIDVDFVKIKLWDKQKSLDSINKMLGFDVAQKIDVTSKGDKLDTAGPIIQVISGNTPPLSGDEKDIEPNKILYDSEKTKI